MKNVYFFKNLNTFSKTLKHYNLEPFTNQELPVKLHFGEIKNKYYPKPTFVKHITSELHKQNIQPFLYDTTVAYPGLRHSKTGYYKLAKLHGFSEKKMGCPTKIDDTGIPLTIENMEYEVATTIYNATHLFAITHVKGHVATGMGGAIKNFGMGGVTKETKRKMHHGARPLYQKDHCTYCGVCAEVCPFNAIKVKNSTWKLSKRSCFGCGVCVNNCSANAIEFQESDFQKLLAHAAYACVKDKQILYLNQLQNIAKSCDCDPFAGPIICPDIGFLISDDPVAIDNASLDLIHKIKPDVFQKENHINPKLQIKYGEEIGLGSASYNLIEL